MPAMFRRAYPPLQPPSGEAWWLLFQGGRVLVYADGDDLRLPRGGVELLENLLCDQPVLLGTLDDVPCVACPVRSTDLPASLRAIDIRELYGRCEDTLYAVVGYAAHLLAWQRTSRFCPACGGTTEASEGDWGRRCSACGFTRYPQLSPAILALVYDGEQVLLAHKPGWGARYSIIAGFVEPGETLEECVRREVEEEVGVQLGRITYAGSQPWPFPDQLMIGFMAEYAGGTLRIDEQELDDARWFHVDALPEIPAPLSLSRRMIDQWVAIHRNVKADGQLVEDDER